MRKRNAALARKLLLLLVPTAGLFVVAGTGTAEATHFYQAAHTVQFNIYGYSGGPSYNTAISTDIANSIQNRNPKPLSLSFNEVCAQQYNELAFVLAPYGYTGLHTYNRGGPSGYSAPNSTSCSWFGNAVFWLGGDGNSLYFDYFSDEYPGANAKRNWACAKAAYPSYWSCTAHMEAGSESYARLQTNEYRAKVNALRVSGAAVLAAGDFNIDGRGSSGSNVTTIASWYTPYFEADNTSNCRTCARPTTDGNQRKLDYIFRANPKTIAHSAYMFDAAHSDHDWLQMYL